MDKVFLTKEELMQRWRCSMESIDMRVRQGILKPCRNLPGWKIRFADVLKLEEAPLDPMSPLERRRLLREIDGLKDENARLRGRMMQITALAADFMSDAADGSRKHGRKETA